MDRKEINQIINDKQAVDIISLTAEVARKLTIIYENDFGYRGLYFCMISITNPDKSTCYSTKEYLDSILDELHSCEKANEQHFSTIKSMVYAAQASISDSLDDVCSNALDSIEHAYAAASAAPDIYDNINYCINIWKAKWNNMTPSV